MSGSDDWSDSLFKPEKGDSLGDGSWGRESDEPDLAPVAWDKLPEAPTKKARARLATPAPGSQKESGLLDIKALAPDLSKGIKGEEFDESSGSKGTPARLATPAKGSTGSGLIDVNDIAQGKESTEEATRGRSESSGATKPEKLSSSLVDQVKIPLPDSDDDLLADTTTQGRGPLLVMMAVLALAVVGLAYYVFTH